MDILLSGCSGFMGREVRNATNNVGKCNISAGVDTCECNGVDFPVFKSFDEVKGEFDCIVDFSHHSLTKDLTSFAVNNCIPLVIATTGQTDEELEMIKKASQKVPVFFASNYSMGIAILTELAKKTAQLLPDAEVEIVEVHHDRKIDAPSGTALAIAKEVASVREGSKIVSGRSGLGKREKNDIGVQSVRIGNVCGIHEVMIGTGNQTITLKHEAHGRALFAEGALAAARFIIDKEPGLYDMKSMVEI